MSQPSGVLQPPARSAEPLIDLIPGLDRWLSEEDRSHASRMGVPVLTAFQGPFDLAQALRISRAFAIVIVDGLILRGFSLAAQSGLQLLGPGDLVGRVGESGSDLVTAVGLQVRGVVRYAALDDRVLALAQRYPRLIEGLQMRNDDQQQRLVAQLLICQLPRVEDRVLALMWLLAETWGRVATSGIVLPIRLTHDAIGLLIGARRSTVTLALKALEERGALLRRPDDWLILERPPRDDGAHAPVGLPSLVTPRPGSPWFGRTEFADEANPGATDWLHLRHTASLEQSRVSIAAAEATSRRSVSLVEQIRLRRSVGDRLHHQDGPADLPVALGDA